MGAQHPSKPATAQAGDAAPETLARVVLRCRDLARFLEESIAGLPERDAAPFLYGQLEEAIGRLQNGIRSLSEEERASESTGGFLRLFAGRRSRESSPRKRAPQYDLEGNAWTIPVTELVGFLSHSGKSGLLWVTSTSETFVLEFSRGNLVHATSNAPPAAYRLGEILLSERLFQADELAKLIHHARAADDLLGSFLVRSGRLSHAELQRVLSIQVQQLFHRLMDADSAFYRFQEGAQLLKSHSLEVNITQLLLESARRKDEDRQRIERAATPAPEPELEELPLEALEEIPTEPEPAPAAAEDAPGESASVEGPAAALPSSKPAGEPSESSGAPQAEQESEKNAESSRPLSPDPKPEPEEADEVEIEEPEEAASELRSS